MDLVIESYEERHVPAVRELNRRVKAGGEASQFYEYTVPHWLPPGRHPDLRQDFYVAREGDAVRGAYILKWQSFWLHGLVEPVGTYQLPLSDGAVDPAYGLVGMRLIGDALRRSPLLFGLGMGSRAEKLPRQLAALRWETVECPFYFHVRRPFRFFRRLAYLRRTAGLRLAMNLAAFTGLGVLGLCAAQLIRALRGRLADGRPEYEEAAGFGAWADEVWERAKGEYAFIAVRDAAVLNVLYPAGDPRFVRLRVPDRGATAGWVVVMHTRLTNHKQFGDLYVGTLVDCLAVPGAEGRVVAAALDWLAGRGVDLIVTNQRAAAWCAACARHGFLRGTSNYLLAVSRPLAKRLAPFSATARRVHMTRGDGDGPIHL